MHQFRDIIESALGLSADPRNLNWGQLSLRAFIIFFAMLAMIRIGGRRFLAKKNPFDVLLAFLIASLMARAINGSASFFGTLATGFFIAGLYRLLAIAACHFKVAERFLKGEPTPIIRNGRVNEVALRRNHISKEDLEEDLRLNASVTELEQVHLAQVERNGEISVQRKSESLGP